MHFTGTSYSFIFRVRDPITKLLRFRERYSIATRRGNAPVFVFTVRDPITKFSKFSIATRPVNTPAFLFTVRDPIRKLLEFRERCSIAKHFASVPAKCK